MKKFFIHIIFLYFSLKIAAKKPDDIFDVTKNLRFCGADLFSKNLNFSSQNIIKTSKSRHLSTEKYKPIRIFVESTYFEYQSTLFPNLKPIVPIIKTALNKSVEGIKGLLEVKDNGEINYYKDVIINLFNQNNITKWDPIFDNGADIKSDYLIIVKFDTEKKFPQGVLASAVPIYLEQETNRPLIGLLTITIEESYFSLRRVTEYFSEVLLHELTHALGFLYSMFPYFPNGAEGTYTKAFIRNVERTIVNTPKVLEVAKKYFNCSSLIGVELEDQGGQGSALSHWEQRLLLGDYMGAVIYQEEMVISEITLALLEDSGWYKANYYTGGLMRFGKNRGCDFIQNNCLDSNYNTEFQNEFFDASEAYTPSCSAGRQSRTYSILNEYPYIIDPTYSYNFLINQQNFIYSGAMYTVDYCFTHGQRNDESKNGYFTGNCKYGEGYYGNSIYYFNEEINNYECGHPNSEFPKELGEIYSNTSFCIMSSLSPAGKYKLYSSAAHSMCYQIYCSSLSLTIKINNDYIVCPREGGNVKVKGYDGYLHCPDYNLMCTGSVVCNDIFDCIEKKSLVKENTYNYDYIPQTTQKYSKIKDMTILDAYELSEDGVCPKNCSQCNINKKCIICQGGRDCAKQKSDEDLKKDDEASNLTLWIFISIVAALLVVGITIAIFLTFKKKNIEDNLNSIEMISRIQK